MKNHDIYATRIGCSKKREENEALAKLIICVAKKYPVIYGKRGKPKVLYDPTKGGVIWSDTKRFIAHQATRFIRKISSEPGYEKFEAGRYASRRQIERLLCLNSVYTSVHAVTILNVILRLLQLDENSEHYQRLIYGQNNNSLFDVKTILPVDTGKDLAIEFLHTHIEALESDPTLNTYAPGTWFLADYIRRCRDTLNMLVGSNAFYAIRIGSGRPPKLKEIYEIEPIEYPVIAHKDLVIANIISGRRQE